MKPRQRFLALAMKYVTLVIAIWGATLGTYSFVWQRNLQTTRIHGLIEVKPIGTNGQGKAVGNIRIVLSNIGGTTISIAPKVVLTGTDGRTGETFMAIAYFNMVDTVNELPLGELNFPPTIKQGEIAIATTDTIELQGFTSPLGHYSAIFALSNEDEYMIFISGEQGLQSIDRVDGEIVGWTAAGLASRL